MCQKSHCNIGSKRAFPTGVLVRWHNCKVFTYLLTHNLFSSSCIRRYLVSRACDWTMPALPVCTVLLIFSFQFSLLFFDRQYRTLHRTSTEAYTIGFYTEHRTMPEISVPFFMYRAYSPWENFELILVVKMETRHPVEGPFGNEFPAICNHCGVMTAWSRKKDLGILYFFAFLEKRTPMVKYLKFFCERLHGDTDWRCCVQM